MTGWSGPKNQQNKTDKFLSLTGTLYVLVDSGKSKGKVLKEQILKYLIPSGFDARNTRRASPAGSTVVSNHHRIW